MCTRAEYRETQARLAAAVACLDNLTTPGVSINRRKTPGPLHDEIPDDMRELLGKLH